MFRFLGQALGPPLPGPSGKRILLKQSSDHGRVEVGANSYDPCILEIDDPAIAIVEAHAVPGRRQRMKLDHRLIVHDEQMLHMELCALRKYLSQLGEGARDEVLLAVIVTGEGVGPHDNPVNVVSYLFEKGSAVAV